MRLETEPWWRQAQADLQTDEVVQRARQYYAVSWHAQQASEKAVKALYIERHGELPPRTHALQCEHASRCRSEGTDLGRRRASVAVDAAVKRFAERLRDELGAKEVLLFGPHARGVAEPDRDYNLIIVSDRFRSISELKRPIPLYRLFDEAGGRVPLRLTCLTPEEFDYARNHITFVRAIVPEAIDLFSANAMSDAEMARRSQRKKPAPITAAIGRFAERLRDEIGAERVLLFGSQARGDAAPDSDYDLIIVSQRFRLIPLLARSQGLHDLFYEAGGRVPLDLICLSPEEFDYSRSHITLVSAVLPEAIDLLDHPNVETLLPSRD